MYRLTEEGKKWFGLPGVPQGDLSDEEFEVAKALHPAIEERGWYEHVDSETPEPSSDEQVPEPTPFMASDDDAASAEEVLSGRPRRTRRPESEE